MILYYINVGEKEKEVMYTVYQHRNLKNGKSYVGMTSQEPKRRWGNGWGYKKQPKIWSDIKESDWNKDWEHNILGKFENEQEALNIEEMFIWLFDSTNGGYNISSYGNNHYERSEETKNKISDNHADFSGEKHPMFGKHHSEESKKKISEVNTGEKHPMFGRHHSEESKKRLAESKGVNGILQFSKDGEFIAEYPSAHEAERQTGCNPSSICKCCKGKLKSTGGYIWEYKKI